MIVADVRFDWLYPRKNRSMLPMSIAGVYPIMAMQALAGMLMLYQITPPTEFPISSFEQIQRGGLYVALLIAIGVLWRALVKKDDQIAQMIATITSNRKTKKELRKTVEDFSRALENNLALRQMDPELKKKFGL